VRSSGRERESWVYTALRVFSCLIVLGTATAQAQAPRLHLRTSGSQVELRFDGIQKTTNRVQSLAVLGQTNWLTLTNIALASNQPVTVQVPHAGGQRFFRLQIEGLPPVNPHPGELVWIAAGQFTMGSPTNELHRYSREGPLTTVTLTEGFWIGRHEVTQAEYTSIMGANPSFYPGFARPVDRVSWHDATNYCAKRTALDRANGSVPSNYSYRLPTEAEWEYVARAGTTNRFSFGDDPTYALLPNYGWTDEEFGAPHHEVEGKLPNPWGVYDMHGNVYEWCHDWYFRSYPGGAVVNPTGPATGTERVLRGGSYVSLARDTRAAFRDRSDPTYTFFNAGFRVVLARDR
jgi:formylglycine-generating enzyme required for sulfatase activity